MTAYATAVLDKRRPVIVYCALPAEQANAIGDLPGVEKPLLPGRELDDRSDIIRMLQITQAVEQADDPVLREHWSGE